MLYRLRFTIVLLLAFSTMHTACDEAVFDELDKPSPEEVKVLSSFAVTVSREGGLGTPESPLPSSIGQVEFTLEAAALLTDGSVFTSFNREVSVSVEPGRIVPGTPTRLSFRNGLIQGATVTVEQAFGPTRIWIEDVIGDDASFVTGVSDEIFFSPATLASIQKCDKDNDPKCNGRSPNFFPSPLIDKFVKAYRSSGCGDLVVTSVTQDGFYVTDTSQEECPGPGAEHEFGHLFVYNHSKPAGLAVGQRLSSLAGNISEFFGFTEMGFPTWEMKACEERTQDGIWYLCKGVVSESSPDDPEEYAGGTGVSPCPPGKKCCPAGELLVDLDQPECTGTVCYIAECMPMNCADTSCALGEYCRKGRCVHNPYLPDPVIVTPSRVGSHWDMEKLEGGFVKVENVKVLPVSGSDFSTYGQWKVLMSDHKTTITIVSRETVPNFNPMDHEGECIDITGNLRFHSVPRWLIYPRDLADIVKADGCN